MHAAPSPGPLPPEPDRVLAREIFKELIEINTTHDHGSTEAAQAIRRRLLAAGFAESELTFIAPPDRPVKGNLIVRYRGQNGGTKPILFMGHLDVVEAKATDWSMDPFKLTEKDGWLYGRGTIDMKNGDAALVESLIRLKREHFTPERDVIVVADFANSTGDQVFDDALKQAVSVQLQQTAYVTLLADRQVLVIGGATRPRRGVDSVEIAGCVGSESRADLRLPAARAIHHAPWPGETRTRCSSVGHRCVHEHDEGSDREVCDRARDPPRQAQHVAHGGRCSIHWRPYTHGAFHTALEILTRCTSTRSSAALEVAGDVGRDGAIDDILGQV